MGPVSAEIEIDVPRAEAFALIVDLARRPSFADHILSGYHLTRIESSGVGAGARFQLGPRRRRIWMDTAIAEVDAPHKIVEHGCGGRGNRIPATTVWELLEGPGSLITVSVSHWTEPSNPVDRVLEVVSGTARWQERRWRDALSRLRDLLESGAPPPAPLALAGGNRHETGIP
jgi:carbon monoxide dehydrogenase subunit G